MPHFFHTQLGMAIRIDKVKDRDRLPPRHEPYWVRVRKGCYVGLRKTSAELAGSWVARFRDEDLGQRELRSLGRFEELPQSDRYDAAKRAAEEWFSHKDAGGSAHALSVKDACDRYVAALRRSKGDAAAVDAQARFKRWIHGNARLAGTELLRLRQSQIKDWRQAIAAAPAMRSGAKRASTEPRSRANSSINRDMTTLRAALNLALDEGHVASDGAWRTALRPIKNADGRRTTYLDVNERRRLIAAAASDVSLFMRALSSVPLRPGALAKLNVADFDARLSTLTIAQDKTGPRQIALPPSTADLFRSSARERPLTDPLLARSDGKRWDKDAWKYPFKDAVRASGVPNETTAYTLRHSVITDLVTGGLDLLTVAQISGTSVLMIERHYGHLRREHAKSALALLAL